MESTIIQILNQKHKGIAQPKLEEMNEEAPVASTRKSPNNQLPQELKENTKKNYKKAYSPSYRTPSIQKDAMARTLMEFKDKEKQRMK
ncbi:hypothetical protein O181_017807 [Austropuccinia psidii MF-1]|uniref:Uncharacterized protein n=1 Tax=Austropuccinia psidii MF-1 TaxID=1389203 RepID=A0A9Q3GSX1_9BASI|nr:hypothetical protein [Austropuccinia psidii MF-1]